MPRPTPVDSLLGRSSVPWTTTFRLAATPTCPHCLLPLPAADVWVSRSLLVCGPCWRQGFRCSRRWWNRTKQLNLTHHFTSVCGLHAFTPAVDWPARTPLALVLGLVEMQQVPVLTHRERHA